jgi:hypothetical protein
MAVAPSPSLQVQMPAEKSLVVAAFARGAGYAAFYAEAVIEVLRTPMATAAAAGSAVEARPKKTKTIIIIIKASGK